MKYANCFNVYIFYGLYCIFRFGGGYILRLRVAHDASVTDAMDQVDIAFPGSVLVVSNIIDILSQTAKTWHQHLLDIDLMQCL